MTRQLRLTLRPPPAYARGDFVVSGSNAAAVAAVDAWPDWLGGALAVVGPEGCGKAHLGTLWAERAGAAVVPASALTGRDLAALGARPVLVQRADLAQCADEALFHLLNRAAAGGGGLLLTGHARPTAWPCALPDLRSRLNAIAVTEIAEPDDALLSAVLARFLRAHSITPLEDVLGYLVNRIERSVPHARAIADALDGEMDARQRPLTKVLAREILEKLQAEPDLFDDIPTHR